MVTKDELANTLQVWTMQARANALQLERFREEFPGLEHELGRLARAITELRAALTLAHYEADPEAVAEPMLDRILADLQKVKGEQS